MKQVTLLRFSQLPIDHPSSLQPDHPCGLGMQCVGRLPGPLATCLPVQDVRMPLLADSLAAPPPSCLIEHWQIEEPVLDGQSGAIRFRQTENILFGVVELNETDEPFRNQPSPLRAATELAYRQILALQADTGMTRLWRVWNYLPDIHGDEAGLERYRQFNIGRHQALGEFGIPVDRSPAASALGVREGGLSIAFLAGCETPGYIENPRQISAFAYPQQYGPRSPAFTRATTIAIGSEQWLFVSGTASIVGHETRHPGDVVAQTQETMANLAALLDQANRQQPAAHWRLDGLIYRVYLRHASDYPTVKTVLTHLLGLPIQVTYVQADICRRDLLVEIEALARLPSTQPG